MKTYTCFDAPLQLFGVPFFNTNKKLCRLPEHLRAISKDMDFLGRRCPGARIGFKTNAEEFIVRATLKTFGVDAGMSIFSCQSISVMLGERINSVFLGLVSPSGYGEMTFERSFKKSAELQEITLWLPRNEEIENVEVIVPETAIVTEPTPYKYGKAVYYGSSITEGGCCCNVTNSYNALLSRWLDLDYYNLGFSGNAKGELAMAEYINSLDMSLFVMDYDHNAPDVEHLEKTHEPFFKAIREKNPMMPILLMTRPNFDYTSDADQRRAVVKRTYDNAINNGDKNVYFIDGERFFGDNDRQLCTIDTTHPNDLGFYRMAKVILPVMQQMLAIK